MLIPTFIPSGWAVTGTISASPSTVNLTQTVYITFSFAGGTPGTFYTFRITVTKPGGTDSASNDVAPPPANATGGGNGATQYPCPSGCGSGWIPNGASGPAGTDTTGTYNVVLDKTFPNPLQTGVASDSFDVDSRLTVTVVSPSVTSVARGDTVPIIASVVGADGQPMTTAGAAVTATTPSSTITLPPSGPAGTYSSQYQVQRDDPTGSWNLIINATSPGLNSGSSLRSLTVLPAQLIIQNLATYNSFGVPTSDFSPGDTLYARFQIAYSGSGYVNDGTFTIQVRDPSGRTVASASLAAIYDTNRALFYTPSGLQISTSDPDGSWQLVIPASSLSDVYGNIGPSITITYRFQVHQSQFVVSQFYLVVAALAGVGAASGLVFLRRFNTATAPFESLFKLTGGEIQPPASLLLIGDAGAGATTLGLQLLYRDLTAGKPCGLLSYDSFPSEVTRKMRDMGWDITPYLERKQLNILDCYSALAGVEGGAVRDPTDFTEVSIQVTAMMEKAKGPGTVLFDSTTPIFNSSPPKECINFLQVLGAKVKNNGGTFIMTASRGSIPEEARSKIESLADGVIEMGLKRKAKTLARTLQVKKVSGREITSTETEFTIVAGKGILLKKQRIPIGIFQPK